MIFLVNAPSLYDQAALGLTTPHSWFEVERLFQGTDDRMSSVPGEHLGLMSLLAACRRRGVAAHAINGMTLGHRSLDETWASVMAASREFGRPDVIGLTGPAQVFSENIWLAREGRRAFPGAAIVLGHDFATLNATRLLQEHEEFDIVCRGEGEEALPELAEALAAGRSASGVAGLALREGGRVVFTAARPPVDLDTLAPPAREDLTPVLEAGLSAAVYSTRGCPYRCSYCTTGQTGASLYGRDAYRSRNISSVVDEIEYLQRDFGVQRLGITDDLFLSKHPASRGRAEGFAEELLRRRTGVQFMVDCRIDSIERDSINLLARAGLYRVFVGIESGDPGRLADYGKRYTRAEEVRGYIKSQLAILEEAGVEVVPGMIMWSPSVTATELRSNLQLLEDLDYQGLYGYLSRVDLHPGTSIYREYKERGLLLNDWPLGEWRFEDPRAAAVFEEISDVAGQQDAKASDVAEVFNAAVAAWLSESSAPVITAQHAENLH